MDNLTNFPPINKYIGARYVPIFDGAWSNLKKYEPLVVVEYQGNSYTSKTFVPTGIEITNITYWALTGNYNAQVEEYRKQVEMLDLKVNGFETSLSGNTLNIAKMLPFYSSYYNGLELGLIPNDETKAISNSTILNNAMSERKFVYLPAGIYHINQPITLINNSGLIGEASNTSVLKCKNDTNCINIAIKFRDNKDYNTFVILKNLHLKGTSKDNTSFGISIYNDTFVNECNRDKERYNALIGTDYALELEDSIIEDIVIDYFYNGIHGDIYCAVALLRNFYIQYCHYGVDNVLSDSIFTNFRITNCNIGLRNASQNNKFDNFKIYMCGYADSEFSLLCEADSNRCQFSNFDVQESYKNGAIFINCKDCYLDLNIDSCGFKNSENAIGVQFTENCENILGSLICSCKNSPSTQNLGCFIADTCKNFNIIYAESNQKSSIFNATKKTIELLNITINNGTANLSLLKSTGSGFVKLKDGVLDIVANITTNDTLQANETIATFEPLTYITGTNFSNTQATGFNGIDSAGDKNIQFYVDGKNIKATHEIPTSTIIGINTSILYLA